jgi:alkyl hydroperoxide reductase subunit AhpC
LGQVARTGFPPIGDFNREVTSALGIMIEDFGGDRDMSVRAISFLDPNGQIAYTDVQMPHGMPGVEAGLAKARETAGRQS